jgi:hypothetical protein
MQVLPLLRDGKGQQVALLFSTAYWEPGNATAA